jgi:hypothetical protein
MRDAPVLENWKILSIADDVRICIPENEIHWIEEYLMKMETVAAKHNQILNRPKCKILHLNANVVPEHMAGEDVDDAFVNHLPVITDIPYIDVAHDSFESLGADVTFCPDKMLDKLRNTLDKILELMKVYINEVGTMKNLHMCLYLLRTAVMPIATSNLRVVVPTDACLRMLKEYDDEIDELLDGLFNVGITSSGDKFNDPMLRLLRREPLNLGGLAIPYLHRIAKTAFLGSIALTKNAVLSANFERPDYGPHGNLHTLIDTLTTKFFPSLETSSADGTTSTLDGTRVQSALTIRLNKEAEKDWYTKANSNQNMLRKQFSDPFVYKALTIPVCAVRLCLQRAYYCFRTGSMQNMDSMIARTNEVACTNHKRPTKILIWNMKGEGDYCHSLSCKPAAGRRTIRHTYACDAIGTMLTKAGFPNQREIVIENRDQARERINEAASQAPASQPSRRRRSSSSRSRSQNGTRKEIPTITYVDVLYNNRFGRPEAVDLTVRRIEVNDTFQTWSKRNQEDKIKRYAGPTANGRNLKVHPLVFTPLGMPDNLTNKWFDNVRKLFPTNSRDYRNQVQRLSNNFFKFAASMIATSLGLTPLRSDTEALVPLWQHV